MKYTFETDDGDAAQLITRAVPMWNFISELLYQIHTWERHDGKSQISLDELNERISALLDNNNLTRNMFK